MDRIAAFVITCFVVFSHATAWALPSVIATSRTVDDATVSLRVLDQSIAGDSKSWCEITVVIESLSVPLTAGDDVYLWVYEADPLVFDDDILWEKQFEVSAMEATSGRLEKTFNCSSSFEGTVWGGYLEIYGKARVEKAACTGFCIYDRPSTPNAEVEEIADDSREDDDVRSAAGLISEAQADLICADEDWFEIVLDDSGQIDFEVRHNPGGGRLDVDLFDEMNDPVAVGTDLADRSTVQGRNLPMGSYFVRVSARDALDFGFYDVQIDVESLTTVCDPGTKETRPCAQCGEEERICGPAGTWGGWALCEGQGECQPGDQMSAPCGFCGEMVSECSTSCLWSGETQCVDEGVCKPGAVEVEPCEVGARERRCGDGCMWDEFGPCRSSRLGAPCMGDADCDDYLCVTQNGLFPDGYCGLSGCSSDEECGENGSCTLVFGQPYCLSRCSSDDGCRSGYTCIPTMEGGACAPRCRGDGDCFAPGEGCVESTGQCGAIDNSESPGLGEPVEILTSEGAESDGCACSTYPSPDGNRRLYTIFLFCLLVSGRRRITKTGFGSARG